MSLRAKIVLMTQSASWVHETTIAVSPFPGLGIRFDTYVVFNVESVVVGDSGCDVTCIGQLDGDTTPDEQTLEELGFECAPYP